MSIDSDYKKLMLWLAAAFVASIVAAFLIVELVMRHYGEQ